MSIISILLSIIMLAAQWMVFKKMGRKGWEGIIPIYNTYVLCEELYGNGWKILFFLIPLYNIYFMFKMQIDFVHKFGKETPFAFGVIFLPYIFYSMIAFGNSVYEDGTKADTSSDFVTNIVDKIKSLIQ